MKYEFPSDLDEKYYNEYVRRVNMLCMKIRSIPGKKQLFNKVGLNCVDLLSTEGIINEQNLPEFPDKNYETAFTKGMFFLIDELNKKLEEIQREQEIKEEVAEG